MSSTGNEYTRILTDAAKAKIDLYNKDLDPTSAEDANEPPFMRPSSDASKYSNVRTASHRARSG